MDIVDDISVANQLIQNTPGYILDYARAQYAKHYTLFACELLEITTCFSVFHADKDDLKPSLSAYLQNHIFARYSPLVTAVYAKNYSAVEWLVSLGLQSHEAYFGIIRKEKHILPEFHKPMVLAIKEDDVRMMKLLMPTYEGETPLAHLAIEGNAIRCFNYLLKSKDQSLITKDSMGRGILLAAAGSLLPMLKHVYGTEKDLDIRQHGDFGCNILHYCTFQHLHPRDSCFFHYLFHSEDLPYRLSFLIEKGATALEKNNQGLLALDYLMTEPSTLFRRMKDLRYVTLPVKKYHKTILKACKVLLDQMKIESHGTQPLVHENSLRLLQRCINYITISSNSNSLQRTLKGRISLQLASDMCKLLLNYGVSIHKVLDHFLLGYRNQVPATHWLQDIQQHVQRLLEYGSTVTSRCVGDLLNVLQWASNDPEETAICWVILFKCSRMMSEENYATLRIALAQNNSQLPGIHNYPAVRPLQELCRLKIYDNVPTRRMIAHVDDLPFPKTIKFYLAKYMCDIVTKLRYKTGKNKIHIISCTQCSYSAESITE